MPAFTQACLAHRVRHAHASVGMAPGDCRVPQSPQRNKARHVIARSAATKPSQAPGVGDCFATLAMTLPPFPNCQCRAHTGAEVFLALFA